MFIDKRLSSINVSECLLNFVQNLYLFPRYKRTFNCSKFTNEQDRKQKRQALILMLASFEKLNLFI